MDIIILCLANLSLNATQPDLPSAPRCNQARCTGLPRAHHACFTKLRDGSENIGESKQKTINVPGKQPLLLISINWQPLKPATFALKNGTLCFPGCFVKGKVT